MLEAGLVLLVLVYLLYVVRFSAAARLRRRELRAEQAARRQRRAWLEIVKQQMAYGSAGDASREEARAALSGRGGRASKFDEEFF